MSRTSMTVTEPVKEHIADIRDEYGLDNFNDAVLYILFNDIAVKRNVPDANTRDDPGVIKVTDNTLDIARMRKEKNNHETYDDLMRVESGATQREKGEQPIDWEPLDA